MAQDPRVYLDYNATTPLDPRVLEAMLPYLRDVFGNASSRQHAFGRRARDGVETARQQVARLIGAHADEIVFTSGGTESNNLAIKGLADACEGRGRHVITCKTEHKAVVDPCEWLEGHGFEVTWLEPDAAGRVAAQQVADAITDRTVLITLMTANNETGTLHPIAEIGRIARPRGILLHTDAVQGVGKMPLDVEQMQVDLLSSSAHKLYGPKGIGCLYVRRGVKLACQVCGGGHEGGLRSGTLNVPGIVGFGAACDLAPDEAERHRIAGLRDRLHERIRTALSDVTLNGARQQRLCNTLNLSFGYVKAEPLMKRMPRTAVSTGSACSSASDEPSHVLAAMGVSQELIEASIRFSLGRFTTGAEIDAAAEETVRAVRELREMNPLHPSE
ncbi:MAG: cysteine desulfurase family protein [Planctomycetota bacterium]